MPQFDWNVVPEEYWFMREAVNVCGETRLLPFDYGTRKHVPFAQRATPQQLDCLTMTCKQLLDRNCTSALVHWIESARYWSENSRNASWHLGGILIAMDELGKMDIEPFTQLHTLRSQMQRIESYYGDSTADATQMLPPDLSYLAEPIALFMDKYVSESDMLGFLNSASDEEVDSLASCAEHIRLYDDFPKIRDWLATHSDDSLGWSVSRLLNLMDLSGFAFESPGEFENDDDNIDLHG